jgi:2'-5' RNA ligase
MKRVFAAIDISEEVREEVLNYIDDLRIGFDGVPVKWEKPEKLHITVKFAGSVDERQFEIFSEQIQAVAGALEPFQLKIAGAGAFVKRREPSVLWLGVEVVSAADDPIALLSKLHEGGNRPFRPHLTIARVKDARKAEDLIQKHKSRDFKSRQFFINELAIYESTLLPTGSLYSNLASFIFGGQR